MLTVNKEIVEKIINSLLNILIFICSIFLLVAIYTGFQTRIMGNDYANFFGYSLFEVQTGSMADTINAGDWIIIKLTKDVQRNDIVTYESNGEYITHRIIEVYNGTFITKGDANNTKDEPIDQAQVIGKVVKVLPNFGIVRKTLFNPAVLVMLIITLLVCNIVFNNRPSTGNIYVNTFFDNIAMFFGNVIQKLDSQTKIKGFVSLFNKNKDAEKTNDYILNMTKRKSELTEQEYEQVEKDLEKTALYRIVSVDADDVSGEFKVLAPQSKTEEEIEEELGKTALYRIVSVDANEISEKYRNEKQQQEIDKDKEEIIEKATEEKEDKPKVEKYAEIEDELGKTAIFRVVSVDEKEVLKNNESSDKEEADDYRFISINTNEVNNTFVEIAKHEVEEEKQTEEEKENKIEKTEVDEKVEETEEDDEEETVINLEFLKSKNARRGKNIIDKVIIIKKEELNELIEAIVKDDKTYIYRANVKDSFISAYTDAKYYNYYGTKEIGTRGRSLMARVKKMMEFVADDLTKKYVASNPKYEEIIKKYYDIFVLIANLEQGKESITGNRAKKEYYKKELLKYNKTWDEHYIEKLIKKIMVIQKRYADTINFFLKKLETNLFELKIKRLTSNKKMFALDLRHNLSFSKIYSDYIIDKTYTKGIVAEDKIQILLSLLSVQLIDDMMSANFDKEYIFYLPTTLYEKERKLSSTLNLIDNEYAKNHTFILVPYSDLIKNHKVIKEYRKKGYRFALTFTKEDNLLKKYRSRLYIVDALFINKNDENMKDILSSIPEDLSDKVISEDVVPKVGDLGGE